MVTTFDPMSPLPPITTIFMALPPWCVLRGWAFLTIRPATRRSFDRHQHRSAFVLYEEHQKFRRLGGTCVPANEMNIVGALIKGLSWCQGHLFSSLHLHHNRALQHINECLRIVSVDRI